MPRPYGLLLGEGTTKNMRGLGTEVGDSGEADSTSWGLPTTGMYSGGNSGEVSRTTSSPFAMLPWIIGGFGLFLLLKQR